MSENFIPKYTGNPFVDAGVSAIQEWTKKELNDINKDDIIKMIGGVLISFIMCQKIS